jgi:hypothetical protein
MREEDYPHCVGSNRGSFCCLLYCRVFPALKKAARLTERPSEAFVSVDQVKALPAGVSSARLGEPPA